LAADRLKVTIVRAPPRNTGFTLIERLIAVAIVAILSSVAVPGLLDHIRRSARADAKAALLEDAQALERNMAEANRYDRAAGGAVIALPATQSPRTGAAVYSITLDATATTYKLTAAPTPGGRMASDACGSITLDHLRENDVLNAMDTVERCWNR
jgi:type IV pilus assembly protein PilE